ncbi:MAG: cyanophycin synthetase [Candidatus Thermoplasmatota archaeon]|nr:cyanophycin synthetase [Candidatus Thermoplasmatota archaeon]
MPSETAAPVIEKEAIEIERIRFLRGPNVHALFPVMEAVLELGGFVDTPSNPDFASKLALLFPPLGKHKCSMDYEGGFVERLNQGTYPAHIIEHTTLAILEMLGSEAVFGKSREIEGSRYRIVVEYESETLVENAFKLATHVVSKLLMGENVTPQSIQAQIWRMEDAFEMERLGPSTRSLLQIARDRKIPFRRLSPRSSLFSLGWGCKQKRIWASVTSETSAISSDIAQDKNRTKGILEGAGIPVPRGYIAKDTNEALEAARKLGWPVLIKPQDGNHGRGVMGNLTSEEGVIKAVEVVKHISEKLLVEEFVTGDDYRFLVVDFKLVAAARRNPPYVLGDGMSTIAELVEDINRDPRRGFGHENYLTKLRLDTEALQFLAEQGLAPIHVPLLGQKIYLRAGGNLSVGGTAEDVTDIVHPLTIKQIERGARIIGLDVAGFDVVCSDITKTLAETRGAVIEVNAAPGLRMHLQPTMGKGRPVNKAIIDKLFPDGNGRIPLVAITGTNGKTTTSRMVEWIARKEGKSTGMAVTGGIYVNGERIVEGDTTGPWSARLVLDDPIVEFAVLETARGGILRRGLGFDRSSVGVLLNIKEDHMGVDGIETLEDIFWIKSVVTEAVENTGTSIINALDHFAPDLLKRARGKPFLFSAEPCSLLEEHIKEGGDAIWSDGNKVFAIIGGEEKEIGALSELSFMRGSVRFLVENAMAAVSAAWAAGIPMAKAWEHISSFTFDEEISPGRMNTGIVDGKTVILDYAHNPDGLRAISEYAASFGGGKMLIGFSAPGDRHDALLRTCGSVAAEAFDFLAATDTPSSIRGRPALEIAKILAEGASQKGKEVMILPRIRDVVKKVMSEARAGDVVVFADLDLTFAELKRLMD